MALLRVLTSSVVAAHAATATTVCARVAIAQAQASLAVWSRR